MNILSLDIGTKRIGIAKGNSRFKIANPLTTLNRTNLKNDLIFIKNIILENNIELIILGLPMTLSGKEEHSARYVRKFAKDIQKVIDISIEFWDERFSSVSAERVLIKGNVSRQNRKGKVDKVAATIILQNYLDSLEFKNL